MGQGVSEIFSVTHTVTQLIFKLFWLRDVGKKKYVGLLQQWVI